MMSFIWVYSHLKDIEILLSRWLAVRVKQGSAKPVAYPYRL